MNLQQTVQKTIQKNALILPQEKVLVAVSGGQDSVCLLHALKQRNDKLHVLHVDHGLRGRCSDQDRLFVKRLCASWKLPCTVVRANVSARQKRTRTGWEEAGRKARYQAYWKVAQRTGCSKVATAHTLDDHAETLILHMIRGTGPRGLGGIPLRRLLGPRSISHGVEVIRPFLEVTRKKVLAYGQEKKLSWRLDESNRDERFARNRLRHQVLPVFESVNRRFREHLGELAEIMAQEERDWQECLKALLPEITYQFEGKKILDITRLFSYPVIVQRRLLKGFLDQVLTGVKAVHVKGAWALSASVSGQGSMSMGKGWTLQRQYKRLLLHRPAPTPKARLRRLKIPGQVALAGAGGFLKAEFVSAFPGRLSPQEAYFDWDALENKRLAVRFRQSGDRFRPDGLGGTQKLKEFFIDHKIPLSDRRTVPLVLSGREILWVAGHRRNATAKVTEKTKRILKLELFMRGVS